LGFFAEKYSISADSFLLFSTKSFCQQAHTKKILAKKWINWMLPLALNLHFSRVHFVSRGCGASTQESCNARFLASVKIEISRRWRWDTDFEGIPNKGPAGNYEPCGFPASRCGGRLSAKRTPSWNLIWLQKTWYKWRLGWQFHNLLQHD